MTQHSLYLHIDLTYAAQTDKVGNEGAELYGESFGLQVEVTGPTKEDMLKSAMTTLEQKLRESLS